MGDFDYTAIEDPKLRQEAKTGVEKIMAEEKPAPVKEPPKPENIPENIPEAEPVKELPNAKPEQENRNEVNQPGALDIKKNDRYETPGIDMQSPDPFPNDDKHKKLRPVYKRDQERIRG